MKKKNLLMTAIAIFGLATITFGQTVPSYIPTSGLVAWWPFNGNANDESGNGNNATTTNATITTDRNGNVNTAYSFNGTSNFIEFPDSPPLRLNNTDFTISFWVNVNTFSNGSNGTSFLCKRGSGSNNGWIVDANSDASYSLSYQVSSGSDPNVSSITTISSNVWHNLIVRYSLATQNITFYYDGVLDSSPSTILPTPNSSCSSVLRFGWDTYSPPNPYWLNGKLDDIGIWNRALTPQEITDLYNGCQLSVSTQPINQSVNISNNAQFTTASSDPLATYQWQTDLGVGFQNLNSVGQYSGTTNDTLTIANTTLSNNNQPFRCIVSSGSCTDTSNVAVLTVTNNVGINEFKQDNLFSVFPNPAQSVINVKADSKLIGDVYSIYDNTGRVVLTGKLNSQNTIIELGNLSGGIYMFSVGENMKQTFKVIKE